MWFSGFSGFPNEIKKLSVNSNYKSRVSDFPEAL
jgi:hypothetical protein